MRILHLNTSDTGGAAVSAKNLHSQLLSRGHESCFVCLKLSQSYPPEQKIFSAGDISSELLLANTAKQLAQIGSNAKRIAAMSDGGADFSDRLSLLDLSRLPQIDAADIVHLHWINSFLDTDTFFERCRKPIVWTLTDFNPCTGGCHYPSGCLNFEAGCCECPRTTSASGALTAEIWKSKQKAYSERGIRFVAQSDRFAEIVRTNPLVKSPSVIPCGIDTEVFSPQQKAECRRLLGIPEEKRVILFCAEYATRRKGEDLLIEALKHLVSIRGGDRLALLTFGREPDLLMADLPISVYSLSYVRGAEQIARCYGAADILAFPSREESFGLACLEAMSCGLPVVSFSAGFDSGLVVPDVTGYVAGNEDSLGYALMLRALVDDENLCRHLGQNARKHAVARFSLTQMADAYLLLYAEMLAETDAGIP